MRQFDRDFLQQMKKKLEIDMIGVASIEKSSELKDRAVPFLPTVKSVIVFAKETYKEVVSLVGPSKETGEAELGEVLSVHANYINGRLNRAVHEFAEVFHQEGYRSIPLCAAPGFITDQRFLKALFSFKHAAELAGLGTLGSMRLPAQKMSIVQNATRASVSVRRRPSRSHNPDKPTPSTDSHAGFIVSQG
jgi:hypothetical protein